MHHIESLFVVDVVEEAALFKTAGCGCTLCCLVEYHYPFT